MAKTLLILAAGMGSRYGGMKQLDRLGPSGECIMDYSVYDAIQAGFDKVVFVIRKCFEADFREHIVAPLEGRIRVDLAFQEQDDLPGEYNAPENREKPWGTGHAIWVARDLIHEPFAVINADDFYGREAFDAMGDYLEALTEASCGQYAMCAYRLKNTLSAHGHVSRGVCQVKPDNTLETVVEHTAIEQGSDGQILSHGQPTTLRPDDLVSMNFWGFTPDIFQHLTDKMHAFLEANLEDPGAEFYIPFVVDELIREGAVQVRVLQADARWFGVTYQADRDQAVKAIQDMVTRNVYPEKLF